MATCNIDSKPCFSGDFVKVDQGYLKGLLEAFEASDNPTTDISELGQRGFKSHDPHFIFHLQILADEGLVQSESGTGLGYKRSPDGFASWSVVPLRLTAQGHEFIEALRNSAIWDEIKQDFKDASLGTLRRVAKGLLEGYTRKKVVDLLGGEYGNN